MINPIWKSDSPQINDCVYLYRRHSLAVLFLSFTFLFHFLKSQDAQWTLGKKDCPLKKQLTSPMKGKQTKKKNYNTVKIIYTCCPFLFSNNL